MTSPWSYVHGHFDTLVDELEAVREGKAFRSECPRLHAFYDVLINYGTDPSEVSDVAYNFIGRVAVASYKRLRDAK